MEKSPFNNKGKGSILIINVVINALLIIAKEKRQRLDNTECTHAEISKKICSYWGQTVRFMYDPRTTSTAMRILKELGVIIQKGSKTYELNKLVHPEFLPWGKRQAQLLYK